MGMVHIMKNRGGESLGEYKKALKMAKRGIEILCDLSDDMEDEYGYKDDEDDEEYEDSRIRKSSRRYR